MDDALRTAVERWLIKDEHDLTTAQTVPSIDPPVTDAACFHAQHCVEKCLLVAAGVHIERTHYLPRLVALCSVDNPDLQNLSDTAIELTDYAVSDRYPDNWREIPEAEAQDAVRKAGEVMVFVRAELGM